MVCPAGMGTMEAAMTSSMIGTHQFQCHGLQLLNVVGVKMYCPTDCI